MEEWDSSQRLTKGGRTRDMIVARSAPLFNCRGYAGVSLSAIMAATGLEKGGIYRHFDGKDSLAVAAFDYNFGLLQRRLLAAVRGKPHAVDKLLSLVSVYEEIIGPEPLIVGGCPILNTAVEADDAHPLLQERARAAMKIWQEWLIKILEQGMERGEVQAAIDPAQVATVIIATIEGAIMMTKLYEDNLYIRCATSHLQNYLETAVRA